MYIYIYKYIKIYIYKYIYNFFFITLTWPTHFVTRVGIAGVVSFWAIGGLTELVTPLAVVVLVAV